jgi:hypothetical protein
VQRREICELERTVPDHPTKARTSASILWVEAVGFSLIIAIVWVTEIFGLRQRIFGDPEPFLWVRPVLRTVVVGIVWFAVHVATRRLLRRLHHLEEFLLVCAWCRRIGHESDWMTMEQYFGSALSTQTTHGVCPQCAERLVTELGQEAAKRPKPAADRVR